jgi:ribosome-binding protein aMBF1 (putative translation factor)
MINWLYCPICGQKIAKVKDGYILKNVLLYCKKCKNEIEYK